jgi:hypothetical protein
MQNKILILSIIFLCFGRYNHLANASSDIIEPDAIDEIINDYDIQGKAGNEFV